MSDVDLYCKIRQFDLENDFVSKEECMKQLSSKHAARCVEELLHCRELAKALDVPLSVHGLRAGWSVSQWHKYSRYSEVMWRMSKISGQGLNGLENDCAFGRVEAEDRC